MFGDCYFDLQFAGMLCRSESKIMYLPLYRLFKVVIIKFFIIFSRQVRSYHKAVISQYNYHEIDF